MAGCRRYLDTLGFNVAGYSCATCVGASGPIDAEIEKTINDNDVVACAVLSGNRNFESRIHPAVRAAFLASPPLVVAFAVSGPVNIDVEAEPLGIGQERRRKSICATCGPVRKKSSRRYRQLRAREFYSEIYGGGITTGDPLWRTIPQAGGELYPWDEMSDYIKEPPFLGEELTQTVLHNISARARSPSSEIPSPPITSARSAASRRLAGGPVPARPRGRPGRFQQLRRAPHES